MITEISDGLFVSDIDGCGSNSEYATVHACKHPCYHNIVGNVGRGNPNYFYFKTGGDIFLNMVDADYEYFSIELMLVALLFITKNIKTKKVLIHCNAGLSRSPSLGLLYLFRNKFSSFREAQREFVKLYPQYNPSLGIRYFIETNWMNFCDTK